MLKRISKKQVSNTLLLEVAWEVLNQVGGIYTVVRSKAPTVVSKWGKNYCLLGPYMPQHAASEFEPTDQLNDPFGRAVAAMRKMGYDVHYGAWLVSGRPKAVLFNLGSIMPRLGDIKYYLWEDHGISTPPNDFLLNDVVAFGELVRIFVTILAEQTAKSKKIITHIHEWMAASGIPGLRKDEVKTKIIFVFPLLFASKYSKEGMEKLSSSN